MINHPPLLAFFLHASFRWELIRMELLYQETQWIWTGPKNTLTFTSFEELPLLELDPLDLKR